MASESETLENHKSKQQALDDQENQCESESYEHSHHSLHHATATPFMIHRLTSSATDLGERRDD